MRISDGHGFSATLDDPPNGDVWERLDSRWYLYPSEVIPGWRLWWLSRPGCIDGARPDGTAYPATCNRAMHQMCQRYLRHRGRAGLEVDEHNYAPHPDCTCGIHMVRRLADLTAYLRASGSTSGYPLMSVAYGQGRVARGRESLDDPPETVRVEQCWMGPVIVPHDVPAHWLAGLRIDVVGSARLSSVVTS
ncbi:hypothetical protein C5E44_10200 [Nocardia nova]|uniref:hypothetical protein n=1 Tax=Nocardia nova TaxID=37330 RepID=UPI000CEA627F|nr:hypothetical protein C5E44_10200 [Nocardia nova]